MRTIQQQNNWITEAFSQFPYTTCCLDSINENSSDLHLKMSGFNYTTKWAAHNSHRKYRSAYLDHFGKTSHNL